VGGENGEERRRGSTIERPAQKEYHGQSREQKKEVVTQLSQIEKNVSCPSKRLKDGTGLPSKQKKMMGTRTRQAKYRKGQFKGGGVFQGGSIDNDPDRKR